MLTCFSDFVDSRFRTQDVQLLFAGIAKYFVPFLEASYSILLPHWVNQSLTIILLYPLRCPFKFRFFQFDPYSRWMFWYLNIGLLLTLGKNTKWTKWLFWLSLVMHLQVKIWEGCLFLKFSICHELIIISWSDSHTHYSKTYAKNNVNYL